MPFGFQRINERQQRPNQNIVFIKALEGPDKEIAQDFLERIAAICAPVTKANHLFVASLEEFPPNREFWGRNFNAGECIQLVLKSPTNGRWLPFRFVQMVMMHELAHCQEMNHSRNFWKARNKFADELRELWTKGYTGDGLFGRGQSLYTGQYTEDIAPAANDSPEHLCGGVYRTGGGKRGRKAGADVSQLTYAEKKQRRIEKKFGKGGVSLGGDEEGRVKLENGKKPKGKPRVAGSVRGRELRAAAALARFDTPSKDVQLDDDDETASEDDYDEPTIKIEAMDGDGNKILNDKGKSFVKVCGDEDPEDDSGARQEMEELGGFSQSQNVELKPRKRVITTINKSTAKPQGKSVAPKAKPETNDSATTKTTMESKKIYDDESTESEAEDIIKVTKKAARIQKDDEETASEPETETHEIKPLHKENVIIGGDIDESAKEQQEPHKLTSRCHGTSTGPTKAMPERNSTNHSPPAEPSGSDMALLSPSAQIIDGAAVASSSISQFASASTPGVCPVCSLENDIDALRCAVCSHVLAPSSLVGCWPCNTESCKGLGYVNVGDNGICGLCGAPKA